MKNTELLEKHILNLQEYTQKEKLGITLPKIDDILVALNSIFLQKSIDYAITGGVALDLYNEVSSNRKDIDLLIKLQNPSLENITNTISSLFNGPVWFYSPEDILYKYNINKTKSTGVWHVPYVILHNHSAISIDLFVSTPSTLHIHAIEQKKYTKVMDTNISRVSPEYSIISRIFGASYYNKSNNYDRITQNFINIVLHNNTPLDIEYMTTEAKRLNIYSKFSFMMESARLINSTKEYTNVINNIV